MRDSQSRKRPRLGIGHPPFRGPGNRPQDFLDDVVGVSVLESTRTRQSVNQGLIDVNELVPRLHVAGIRQATNQAGSSIWYGETHDEIPRAGGDGHSTRQRDIANTRQLASRPPLAPRAFVPHDNTRPPPRFFTVWQKRLSPRRWETIQAGQPRA